MMRYFPFFIISLIIYSLFFYHSQQPDSLAIEGTIATQTQVKDKIITLDFEKQAQPIDITKTPTPEILPIPPSSSDKPSTSQSEIVATPLQEASITNTLPESELKRESVMPEIVVAKKPEIKPEVTTATQSPVIKEAVDDTTEKIIAVSEYAPLTPSQLSALASDSALLKGEFYDNNFYLYIDAAVPKSTPAKAKTVKNNQAINKDNAKLKAPNKPTRQIKKVFKPLSNVASNGIPEAIVASGNQPSYPKQASQNKLQGRVTVKFIVSIEGESKAPQVISTSGHEALDQTVLDFVKKERFMPSFDGTKKVPKEQQYSFEFTEE